MEQLYIFLQKFELDDINKHINHYCLANFLRIIHLKVLAFKKYKNKISQSAKYKSIFKKLFKKLCHFEYL